MSGLFGLSINLDENPNTVEPKYSIRPERDRAARRRQVRYASIPNEIVCTENLTPWLKLLPCGSYKGLAHLFKTAPRLFESHYLMASVHYKKTCLDTECTREKLELKQTLSLVYDIGHVTRQLDPNQLAYSFSNLFQRSVNGYCPVASLSKVYFNLARNAVIIFILYSIF